jgi:hypothetical protein
MGKYDQAGRTIAGLLGYNPGPGIYSRLERAVEAMPENVRVQELPGLLKRYKDGVPGWELKATNLDEVIAGRDVVPREELLARVREASPVYTHGEVVLRNPEMSSAWDDLGASEPAAGSARIGQGTPSGVPRYPNYSQGGKDYTEILLTQPGARANEYGNHWRGWDVDAAEDAVAHARFDVHDGYLRVNELQSDLGIHNRKAREAAATRRAVPERRPNETTGEYEERLRANGFAIEWDRDGGMKISEPDRSLPFPMEDSALELLLKRLNLYAAKNGLRGVEIASPRAIADKVGGNISNYEHAYGKVAVGNQQRLGRRLGGMAEEVGPQGSNAYEENLEAMRRAYGEPSAEAFELLGKMRDGRISWKPQGAFDPTPLDRFDSLDHAYQVGMRAPREGVDLDFEMRNAFVQDGAERLYATLVEDLVSRGIEPAAASRQAGEAMPRLVRLAEEQAARNASFVRAQVAPHSPPPPKDSKIIYRGTMSDEMRRRIIEQGIGASVLAPLLMQDEE